MTDFDNKANPKSEDGRGGNDPASTDVIANRLRGLYDSLLEEGTPDFLLKLLDRLDEVEKASRDNPQDKTKN